MTTHDPYAWLTECTMQYWRRQHDNAQKPQLHLVTRDLTPIDARNLKMEESGVFEAAQADLTAVIGESLKAAKAKQQPAVSTLGIDKHGAFYDIEAAASFLDLGIDALQGIGVMLQPETGAADEQMNLTKRSDASAVFRFFCEALKPSIQQITESACHLSNDLRKHLAQETV